LFACFKFNKNVDPHDTIENGWTADKTHFDIFDEKQKKLTVAAIEATKADLIALQEV
jgi:hypothetical protein